LAVNGSGDDQYNRVFSQTGPDANSQSNAIIGLQGQKAGKRMRKGGVSVAEIVFSPRGGSSIISSPSPVEGPVITKPQPPRGGAPTVAEIAFAPRGGVSRKRRGGFMGAVVNQAIVPFSILGMQQTYRKGARGSRKNFTRRNRRR
jgi:hypothetical protein